ncbi:MAG: precorrin-8X methylmutase [Clostridia bacterium]|nr:precorrin-8X methylmutase [Clostridia bacterium]
MVKHSRRVLDVRRMNVPFTSEETQSIVAKTLARTQDEALAQSLQFSPTVVSNIRRLITNGGTIVTDTDILMRSLKLDGLDESLVKVKCFIDDPEVLLKANAKGVTRAEVATDMALTMPGNKLLILGSAPAALSRLLAHRQCEPLVDVSLLCTVTGYAAAVQLKEKLRESDMAFIVTRGKSGGTMAAQAVFEAVLETIRENSR